LRKRILQVSSQGTVAEICELNFLLGERFAAAALAVMRKARMKPEDVAAIGSHGQTIHHLPGGRPPSTLQIGEPAVIAERTGVTTVADFRVGDMAAGGQGAPLVPLADWALFADPARPRVVQNVGGIANLTFLPTDARLEDVIAFDTGPGNMVIDEVVSSLSGGKQRFDRNGTWAARGKVSPRLLNELLRHGFFRRNPPKTTGREEFGQAFAARVLSLGRKFRLSDADLVATTSALTAVTIGDAYRKFIFPRIKSSEHGKLEIILGGGGARNGTLRRMLLENLSGAARRGSGAGHLPAGSKLFTHEDFGIDNSAKEALAFAILARQTLMGLPGNVPSATGARRGVVLGKIVLGKRQD
jgi:anhydro-N-acetylmuramic acid kinase